MYLTFLLVTASGLMVVAQLAPIAAGFGISKNPLNFMGFTVPPLTVGLSLNNLMNGLGRPLFGCISDYIGRELTLLCTFTATGICNRIGRIRQTTNAIDSKFIHGLRLELETSGNFLWCQKFVNSNWFYRRFTGR